MSSKSTFKYPFPLNHGVDVNRMMGLIEKHWRLNRTAVNTDTDIFVTYLADLMSAEIVEANSGEECLTWNIPKNWKVRKAKLCRENGEIVADFSINPLHLWTHSISFSGMISREDLIKNHIFTDPNRPEEFAYHYRNGYKHDANEWGFSLPYNIVKELTDDFYFVDIDTDLDNSGTLKVVDAFLPGDSEDTVFIMAHTCHPALISDGIACIAIAVELFFYLQNLESRKYSYRFLFGPEYFAAAAYLCNANKSKINNLKFGIYLDMLSTNEPIGFQYSMQGNSILDKILKNVMQSHTGIYIERAYRDLWGNDETFYNGPGFLIPTAGIGRTMHREYHYNTDDFEHINSYHMIESLWILKRVVEVFETDFVPIREFNGPLYLSKYGLYIDPTVNKEMAGKVEKMIAMIDGERSCMDIANTLNLDYFYLRDFVLKMNAKNLVSIKSRLPQPNDSGFLG